MNEAGLKAIINSTSDEVYGGCRSMREDGALRGMSFDEALATLRSNPAMALALPTGKGSIGWGDGEEGRFSRISKGSVTLTPAVHEL